MNLIPQDPYSVSLLYRTFSWCGRLKKMPFNKLFYYPVLTSGMTTSILIGIIEYLFEKTMLELRKPFLNPNTFNLVQWKSECRVWQIESAAQIISQFASNELSPTINPVFGPLIKNTCYYYSVRSSDQWFHMNENSALIREMGAQVRIKLTEGMRDIIKSYSEIISEINAADPHTQNFLKFLYAHHEMLKHYMGFTEPLPKVFPL